MRMATAPMLRLHARDIFYFNSLARQIQLGKLYARQPPRSRRGAPRHDWSYSEAFGAGNSRK